MHGCLPRFRRNLARLAVVSAMLIGASSAVWAQDAGRPIPGSPPGTSDVAEGVGGVTGQPPVAGAPGSATFPTTADCGAMTPMMMAALAAAMLLMYAPERRIRSNAKRPPTGAAVLTHTAD